MTHFLAGTKLYAMHDAPNSSKGAVEISVLDAKKYNERGFGIFRSVNSFEGRRIKANLVRINAWAIDMDSGSKEEQMARIRRGLRPSLVVETKRGFQVWFAARNAQARHWNNVVLDRLVPFYRADANARDLCRILRVPGFYHLKDPKHPFLVRCLYESQVAYSERDIAFFYKDESEPERMAFLKKQAVEFGSEEGTGLWERIWRIDCVDFLTKVSGTGLVGGESYSFRQTASGNLNIYVDGKSTSCFIDKNLRIGSLSGGGPTPYQWLTWLGHSKHQAVQIIKTLYPEINHE